MESQQYSAIGSWWERKKGKETDEIDIIGLFAGDKKALIVEVKRLRRNYDHKEFTGTFENRTNPASVKIIKYGNNKKDKLKGVTFKIEKILADKSTELTATKETDANGEITFSDLDPGDYQITETKTVNGHSLLKDPIKVTLPVALTQKEAADKRADTTKAKYDKTNGLYYFYDVTYDVDNEAIPSVPMTGAFDNWKTFVPIILAMALFIGVGIYQMKKRKKPVK